MAVRDWFRRSPRTSESNSGPDMGMSRNQAQQILQSYNNQIRNYEKVLREYEKKLKPHKGSRENPVVSQRAHNMYKELQHMRTQILRQREEYRRQVPNGFKQSFKQPRKPS